MQHYRAKLLVICSLLCCLVAALSPGQAFAKSNASPNSKGCIPGDSYTNVSNWGVDQIFSSPKFGENNPYNTSISKTWSTSIAVSSTLSATGSAEYNVNAVLLGVKQSVNVGVSLTITGTFTDSITVVVPPHQARYAQYGLFQQMAYGDYKSITSSCQITDYGYQESWAPWYIGWDLS